MNVRIPAWIDGCLVPIDAPTVRKRGLRHKVVAVMVQVDGAVLLQKRWDDGSFIPGAWTSSSFGLLHWGETAAARARALLLNDYTLEATPRHVSVVSYREALRDGGIDDVVVDLFSLRLAARREVRPQRSVIATSKWMKIEDFTRDVDAHPERYAPWVRAAVEPEQVGLADLLRCAA